MPNKSWTLIDAQRDDFADGVAFDAGQLGLSGCNVRMRKRRGGLSDGLHELEIENGALRCTLLPERGMGVWKAWLGDLELGWKSPVAGPVHPKFVPLAEPSGLGWLDGFDELLSRCGLYGNGAPEFDARGALMQPLHGRIANLPAQRLTLEADASRGELIVTGVVDECRFHFQKLRLTSTLRTRPGEPGFRIIDQVTNLSGDAGEMQLLYHINFGQPLLAPGARVALPAKIIAPRNARAAACLGSWNTLGPHEPGSAEQVYLFELQSMADGSTAVLLKDASGQRGVGLRFNVRQFPCFTLWKNTPASADCYLTGLEPGTNFPNPRSFEKSQGRVRTLAPGETARFKLAFEVYPDSAAVDQAERDVAELQGDQAPRGLERAPAGWAAE